MSRSASIFLLLAAPVFSLVLALLGLETGNTNLLGWVLLILGVGYPAVTIAYYGIYKRLFWESIGEVLQQEQGDRSFWAIVPGMLCAFFAAPLEYLYLSGGWVRPLWLQIAGLVLVLLGTALGIWARTAMQGRYSGHLQVTTGQSLIQKGPYRLIRHPSYAGFLLVTLGIVLGFASLIGLLALVLLVVPGLNFRMNVEEGILRSRFGEAYQEYQRRVKRLIPGIW